VLLGLQRDLPATGVPAPAEDVDLALDAPLLVRDLRRPAPPVRTDRLAIRLDGVEPTLLALSPERLPAPVISGPAVLAAGAVAAVQVALAGPPLAGAPSAGAHAVRLELYDPHGARVPERGATLLVGAVPQLWALRPAPGDMPGRWSVRATDRLSGEVATWSFELQAP
jgi:hypothetical protein